MDDRDPKRTDEERWEASKRSMVVITWFTILVLGIAYIIKVMFFG